MIEAHLVMDNPGTYLTLIDELPPLLGSGANFPCSVNNFAQSRGEGLLLNPGDSASILLSGTAVHSGGSCQISITYDSPPTKNSVWKVMKSFHGGCPVDVVGNLPLASAGSKNILSPLLYNIPTGLHKGPATIAWTWFNKGGQREMYMRCHKTTIGGSGADQTVFNSLPNMFVANLATTSCKVAEGLNLAFPAPGLTVMGTATGTPIGDCGATGRPNTKQKRLLRMAKPLAGNGSSNRNAHVVRSEEHRKLMKGAMKQRMGKKLGH